MDRILGSSIVRCWQRAKAIIEEKGIPIADGEDDLVEYIDLFVDIIDPVIDEGVDAIDPAMAAWMRDNFTRAGTVSELGHAASYASRLRDHGGIDQLARVAAKLRAKPATKSATITTLQPATDDTYVPCISLLDFKIRDGCLQLTATCRSLDFESKALYNMVELAQIAMAMQRECGADRTRVLVHAISAHLPARGTPASTGEANGT